MATAPENLPTHPQKHRHLGWGGCGPLRGQRGAIPKAQPLPFAPKVLLFASGWISTGSKGTQWYHEQHQRALRAPDTTSSRKKVLEDRLAGHAQYMHLGPAEVTACEAPGARQPFADPVQLPDLPCQLPAPSLVCVRLLGARHRVQHHAQTGTLTGLPCLLAEGNVNHRVARKRSFAADTGSARSL